MRLIDADECTSVETLKAFPVFEEAGANVLDLKELIASCKTFDAVPVVQGKWINEDFPDRLATVRDMAQCSVCGELSHKAEHGYAILSKFCPHCGAKMDLNK